MKPLGKHICTDCCSPVDGGRILFSATHSQNAVTPVLVHQDLLRNPRSPECHPIKSHRCRARLTCVNRRDPIQCLETSRKQRPYIIRGPRQAALPQYCIQNKVNRKNNAGPPFIIIMLSLLSWLL
ncbi:hypothetical protein BD289DRAFT_178439 [Coniella lustricola]|uniref:Uncharacterized protein n=1 Tax=Coniella lustricola TaxID=2025994 RepID=A0A2T3ADL6_9PEZI|nr:hypothetical protein BD289DRAFT_178439 [Coniella lustricola]